MLYKCYINAMLYLSLTISYETIFICEIAYLTLFNILFYILSQAKIYDFQRENTKKGTKPYYSSSME